MTRSGLRRAGGSTSSAAQDVEHSQVTCVFRLIVDKVSRATWTRIPAAREQNYGVIVDGSGVRRNRVHDAVPAW